jgi:hypothetical protein
MYAKIVNSSSDQNNLNESDLIFIDNPKSLVDFNGIQYPLSVLRNFTNEKIYNLFGLLSVESNNDYTEWNSDIQDRVISHYYVSNYVLYKNLVLQNKSQEIIDEVNVKREFEASIEYRKQRKEAYISEISPEQDPVTTLGDVVDALYQAIYHGEVDKLNDLALKIENIKERYPKPTANTA